MLRVNNKLWLISDTHFGHQNIIKFQQRPAGHDWIMLSEWARLVKEKDQILHLGDVALGSAGNRKRWYDILRWMPGEKYLILGNHDKDKEEAYAEAGFTVIPEFVHKGYAFTHRPLCEDKYDDEGNDWHTNIHGHTHSNVYNPEHDGVLLQNRRYINMCVERTELKPRQLGGVW